MLRCSVAEARCTLVDLTDPSLQSRDTVLASLMMTVDHIATHSDESYQSYTTDPLSTPLISAQYFCRAMLFISAAYATYVWTHDDDRTLWTAIDNGVNNRCAMMCSMCKSVSADNDGLSRGNHS